MPHLFQATGGLLLVLAVAGCSGEGTALGPHPEPFCAPVGVAHSDVNVNIRALLARHPPMPLRVETCVKGRCDGGRITEGDDGLPIIGGVDRFRAGASRQVDVHFRALSHGQTVFDGTTTVTLHRGHRTLENCSPDFTWFAQVSAHGDSALRQDHVTYDEMDSATRP